MLTKRGHLLPRNVYISPFPCPLGWPEDMPKSQGLPHHTLILRNALGGGHDLFLKVVFLFSICLFCLCARLVVKVLRSSQRELLGNGLFYLQKFLVFINFYKQSCCHVSLNILPLCKEIVFLSLSLSFHLPSGFPILAPVHLLALLCSFLILTYCLPYSYWNNCGCFNYLKNCS